MKLCADLKRSAGKPGGMLRSGAPVHVSVADVQTHIKKGARAHRRGERQLAGEPFRVITRNLLLLSKVKQTERHPVTAGGSGRKVTWEQTASAF